MPIEADLYRIKADHVRQFPTVTVTVTVTGGFETAAFNLLSIALGDLINQLYAYTATSGGSRISCRGGMDPLGGLWTSDAGALWQKFM